MNQSVALSLNKVITPIPNHPYHREITFPFHSLQTLSAEKMEFEETTNAITVTNRPNILKNIAKLIALFHNTPHCHTPKLIGRPSAYPAGPTISPIDSVNSRGARTSYKGLPPMNSLHLLTSDGIPPSVFGSFSLMHWAKSSAVCSLY
jgi:hypothetical protein